MKVPTESWACWLSLQALDQASSFQTPGVLEETVRIKLVRKKPTEYVQSLPERPSATESGSQDSDPFARKVSHRQFLKGIAGFAGLIAATKLADTPRPASAASVGASRKPPVEWNPSAGSSISVNEVDGDTSEVDVIIDPTSFTLAPLGTPPTHAVGKIYFSTDNHLYIGVP